MERPCSERSTLDTPYGGVLPTDFANRKVGTRKKAGNFNNVLFPLHAPPQKT